MKEDALLAPYLHAERLASSVTSYAGKQQFDRWDGTSTQTSTGLSLVYVVFPLPQ